MSRWAWFKRHVLGLPDVEEFNYSTEGTARDEQPGITVVDENGHPLEANDPLARAISKSFETGEEVIWNEGDPLP